MVKDSCQETVYSKLFFTDFTDSTNQSVNSMYEIIKNAMQKQKWVTGKELGESRYRYPSGEVSPLGALIPETRYPFLYEKLPVYSSVFWSQLKIYPVVACSLIEDMEDLFYGSKSSRDFQNLYIGIGMLYGLGVMNTSSKCTKTATTGEDQGEI